jgi:hypothetical protein
VAAGGIELDEHVMERVGDPDRSFTDGDPCGAIGSGMIARRRPERGAILKRRWSSASPIAQTAPSPTASPKSVVRTCSAVAGAGMGMTVR